MLWAVGSGLLHRSLAVVAVAQKAVGAKIDKQTAFVRAHAVEAATLLAAVNRIQSATSGASFFHSTLPDPASRAQRDQAARLQTPVRKKIRLVQSTGEDLPEGSAVFQAGWSGMILRGAFKLAGDTGAVRSPELTPRVARFRNSPQTSPSRANISGS